ncbi:Hypothetical protein FKW44_011898 [Caligus rogercresseyi]|uniref:Uncharacterized protein n=1 Tax=Caligus rogercresseyi TaxID=217165 RepID=A0A7T8HIY0_CALRO|nr:Hypothetical protein FKW44_011898 [Caligus rogercresseyi]
MASKFHRPSKTAYSQQYLHAYLRLLGYQEDKRVRSWRIQRSLSIQDIGSSFT